MESCCVLWCCRVPLQVLHGSIPLLVHVADELLAQDANTDGQKDTDRQIDRQTDRRTDRWTNRQAGRQTDRQSDRQAHRDTKTDKLKHTGAATHAKERFLAPKGPSLPKRAFPPYCPPP